MVLKDIEGEVSDRIARVARPATARPVLAKPRKREWSAQVLAPFTCAGENGAPVVIRPGDYRLAEIDDVQYELADTSRVWARFWFTQIRQLKRSGALRIEGPFP